MVKKPRKPFLGILNGKVTKSHFYLVVGWAGVGPSELKDKDFSGMKTKCKRNKTQKSNQQPRGRHKNYVKKRKYNFPPLALHNANSP